MSYQCQNKGFSPFMKAIIQNTFVIKLTDWWQISIIEINEWKYLQSWQLSWNNLIITIKSLKQNKEIDLITVLYSNCFFFLWKGGKLAVVSSDGKRLPLPSGETSARLPSINHSTTHNDSLLGSVLLSGEG